MLKCKKCNELNDINSVENVCRADQFAWVCKYCGKVNFY